MVKNDYTYQKAVSDAMTGNMLDIKHLNCRQLDDYIFNNISSRDADVFITNLELNNQTHLLYSREKQLIAFKIINSDHQTSDFPSNFVNSNPRRRELAIEIEKFAKDYSFSSENMSSARIEAFILGDVKVNSSLVNEQLAYRYYVDEKFQNHCINYLADKAPKATSDAFVDKFIAGELPVEDNLKVNALMKHSPVYNEYVIAYHHDFLDKFTNNKLSEEKQICFENYKLTSFDHKIINSQTDYSVHEPTHVTGKLLTIEQILTNGEARYQNTKHLSEIRLNEFKESYKHNHNVSDHEKNNGVIK